MPEYISFQHMRDLEATAIESGAVTGLALMERAGRGVIEAIVDTWPAFASPARAVVLCGPGNNGGDGFVVARLLAARGWRVRVFLYGDAERLPSDARTNFDRWCEAAPGQTTVMSFPRVSGADAAAVEEAAYGTSGTVLVIDALFGIGLTRPLDGLAPLLALNALAFPKTGETAPVKHVSIDVPSGLAEHGPVSDAPDSVFHADLTVTFHRRKEAHRHGAQFCGQIVVADIGL